LLALNEIDATIDITKNQNLPQEMLSYISGIQPIFYPIQVLLANICRILRTACNVIMWDECYITFWLTVVCLLVSFLFLFLPWGWLLLWSTRIVVWLFTGPWMKLIDRLYFTEEKIKMREKGRSEARDAIIEKRETEVRIKKENVKKLKDIRKKMFGKYAVNVPRFKLDHYKDVPLFASYAKEYQDNSETKQSVTSVNLTGQQLLGDMIPKRVIYDSSGDDLDISEQASQEQEFMPLLGTADFSAYGSAMDSII